MAKEQFPTRCPDCGQPVRPDARFCPNCRYSFAQYADSPALPPAGSERPGLVQRLWHSLLGPPAPPAPEPAPAAPPDLATLPTQQLGDEPRPAGANAPAASPAPLKVGDLIAGQFRVNQVYPLDHSTFYEVTDNNGGAAPFLVHEVRNQPALAPADLAPFPPLSNGDIPNVLPHYRAMLAGERRQVVLAYPGSGWRSLSKVAVPVRPLKQAIGWTLQLGYALAGLHAAGWGHWPLGLPGREAIIIHENHARIADLTACRRVTASPVAHDSRVLAELLYFLVVGQPLPAGARELAEVPAQIRPILQSALAGEYSDLKGLLRELATSEAAPGMDRALRQLAGSATHPGRKHTLNQDFIAVLNYSLDQSGQVAPMGLYIVADGMGGHAAGELASQDSVRQAFLRFIEQRILPDLQGKTRKLSNDVSGDTMHALVAQANQLVYQSRQSSGSDRGTTMTAALVIGSRATVANVGDSRTYLWRGGQLQPVTRDHSLVASLVQAGQITPEEVYIHPQRNQIYRSLGDRPEVEVDLFHVSLQKGDRLLLCSDGVWEMVRDAGLQRVLAAALNPQTACDRLVELANANGGEDNISCIVVNME